jgi:hypothetical protein
VAIDDEAEIATLSLLDAICSMRGCLIPSSTRTEKPSTLFGQVTPHFHSLVPDGELAEPVLEEEDEQPASSASASRS